MKHELEEAFGKARTSVMQAITDYVIRQQAPIYLEYTPIPRIDNNNPEKPVFVQGYLKEIKAGADGNVRVFIAYNDINEDVLLDLLSMDELYTIIIAIAIQSSLKHKTQEQES